MAPPRLAYVKDVLEFSLLGQSLALSAQKALFWNEGECLIISDPHLGKAGHFRKAGIPVSSKIHTDDLVRIDILIRQFRPTQLVFLGDLFHSDKNNEWDTFHAWRAGHSGLKIYLTRGNHDIIPAVHYSAIDISVVESLLMGPFVLTHHPEETTSGYNLAGHVHPGVNLSGRSRQGLRLPCFHFGANVGLLPAFGNFTGYVAISPAKTDKVFAVTPSAIMSIQ